MPPDKISYILSTTNNDFVCIQSHDTILHCILHAHPVGTLQYPPCTHCSSGPIIASTCELLDQPCPPVVSAPGSAATRHALRGQYQRGTPVRSSHLYTLCVVHHPLPFPPWTLASPGMRHCATPCMYGGARSVHAVVAIARITVAIVQTLRRAVQ